MAVLTRNSGPITSSKQKEMFDYLHDEFALQEAIERYRDFPDGVRVLIILREATESVIHRMEK